MRTVRIVSNGEGWGSGTKLLDAESGEEIHGVTSISWACDVGEFARAQVEFSKVEVEIIGRVDDGDLIERLDKEANEGYGDTDLNLIQEAADEIRNLRRALWTQRK